MNCLLGVERFRISSKKHTVHIPSRDIIDIMGGSGSLPHTVCLRIIHHGRKPRTVPRTVN